MYCILSSSYIWGMCEADSASMKSHSHPFDGLLNYNYYKANYKSQTFDYTGGYVASTGDANIRTVWYYIESVKRVNEPYFEWYLPAVDELKICTGDYEYKDRKLYDRIVCLAQYDFSSSYIPVK